MKPVTTQPPPAPKPRSAGILLHPTCLPGPYGIGDLGPHAYAFADALARARQKWWQVLPLGPTGYADSPYQCFSAFAGNPYLISPALLKEEDLVAQADLDDTKFPDDYVDYEHVIKFKLWLLERAWRNYLGGAAPALRGPFEQFCAREARWLDDFALFMAIKDAHGGVSWLDWPTELRLRQPAPLERAKKQYADAAGMHRFRQFLFFRQWKALKEFAHGKGIKFIGDVPIFVSVDSADVWANPGLFLLDEDRNPKVVAGVPPDYFSATGQLWGNPHYRWDAMKKTGYAWWIDRVKATLAQVDWIRLDHFRGFEAAWHVPAGMATAEVGRWVLGPGADLFDAIKKALGGLPFIAEDLGIITPEVDALRAKYALPGMRILQFAFGGAPESRFLPHNYENHTVVYTGTHDNDTTWGWYESRTELERHVFRRYVARDGSDTAWDLMRLAWASVADWAVAPLQDVLDLGTEARMNFPGKPSGNWDWRFTPGMLTDEVLHRLAEMTDTYGR